jgi:hypothetical protein
LWHLHTLPSPPPNPCGSGCGETPLLFPFMVLLLPACHQSACDLSPCSVTCCHATSQCCDLSLCSGKEVTTFTACRTVLYPSLEYEVCVPLEVAGDAMQGVRGPFECICRASIDITTMWLVKHVCGVSTVSMVKFISCVKPHIARRTIRGSLI